MLEEFELDGNNSIESLSPIKSLTNLKVLLAYVNVADGDLSICKHMRFAACNNRKHYNIKDKDLPKG